MKNKKENKLEERIKKVSIKKGKIDFLILDFHYDYNGSELGCDYKIKIDNSKVVVQSNEDNCTGEFYDIVEYNLKEDKFLWYLEHSCGLMGYDKMQGDNCNACDNQIEIEKNCFISTTEKIEVAAGSGYYPLFLGVKKFADLISKDIPRYCNELEEKIFKDE